MDYIITLGIWFTGYSILATLILYVINKVQGADRLRRENARVLRERAKSRIF